MILDLKVGIIIQARLGSTRLPNKVLLDFNNGKNILQIIYEKLVSHFSIPIIIATTTNKIDDDIENFCKKNNITFFRGSENDVLSRFINVADIYKFTHVIRVCADNPFLSHNAINDLIENLKKYPDSDYISFKVGEKPSILTHFGFWAELASLNALKIANKSKESIYHEHVTNYIYTNPNEFNLKWIKVSEFIENNNNIRLTVDSKEDFINSQIIYNLVNDDFSPEEIIKIVNSNTTLKQKMMEQIIKNGK